MNGLQEPICAGCEYYEDNYKKALDRFLLYKEKIMCTQTLIQKYEKRKQHNQQLLRKLQKSRQNVAAVRERFMHYMEKYMPLEKSYNDLRAAHSELEDKMQTQSTTLVALQQHNKQLTALVEVQEKEVNEYKDKSEKIEEELKRKLRMNHIAKVKANDKYRSMVKSAVELAVILKDKGMLPDSYKLCLRSWKKQLSQDIKPENFCGNGGLSPDKASSISSQDTGFDSSKSMSDDESPFDESVTRRKGTADDKKCNNTLKSAAPSIPLETSICDKSVNTSDIVKNCSTSCATDSFQNLRDIGVNTSLSMVTSDLSKLLHEAATSDFKNPGESPDQGMEKHDLKPLLFDTDLQVTDPHFSPRGSIFSPVKGAHHSASAEMPPTNAEMPPSNDCVEEYQSSDDIPSENAAVSASPQMYSADLGTSDLSSVKCDSSQADFEISQTCSNNNLVFHQQPAQADNMKKGNLMLLGKRIGSQKKNIPNKIHDQDTEGTNTNCRKEIEPLKRVCHKESSSKYSRVLARFSEGKDVSSMHHSIVKEKTNNSKNILPDPKYTKFFTPDFVKSLNNLTSIIASKKFLKFAKKNNCQRSRRLRKNVLKTIHSPKKHFAASKPSSSYSNIVETASGCFLETVNSTPISLLSVESTPESCKFEERLTMNETMNYRHEEANGAMKVSGRKSKISRLQCKADMLARKKQQKQGRSHLRHVVKTQEVEKSKIHAEKTVLRQETHVTQKQTERKESFTCDVLAHDFPPKVDNQTIKYLEKDEEDTGNEVMTLNSTYNHEGTVNNSECSLAISDTLLTSTNNNSAELKRKDTDTESCSGYTVLLDDLSVSDDDSSPQSVNASNELSHCVKAEGPDDECGNDSAIACNNFSKADVAQDSINNGTKCELMKVNHDVGRERSCDKQCSSENNTEMSEHSTARYFIPHIVTGNESVVNYEEAEINIPIECRQEICVTEQSADLLDQDYDSKHEDQMINVISESGETISEISTCLSASCNGNDKAASDAEVSFSHLNNCSHGITEEVIAVNETEQEMNSVSPSKKSTKSVDSSAQPEFTTDCASQISASGSTVDCAMDCSDVLPDSNTQIFIRGSEVNIDKNVANQDSSAANESTDKKIRSTDIQDMSSADSELSKDCIGTDRRTNEKINQCESHLAVKGHIKEKLCSNNNRTDIFKDGKNTELLTVDCGLQKGAVEDERNDQHKNCDISVNEKSEKVLEEEITHPNNPLKDDLLTQKCERSSVVSNCNIQQPLIGCSGSEELVIKEQQESNKDDSPVERIPPAELDVSKRDVEEVKDTTEASCEDYYIPQRTKKRIAHKPKPQASGSQSSTFQSPIEATVVTTRKQTPRKTKRTAEDEQRNTKTVKTRTQNSSGKHLGHTLNEIGKGLPSLPPYVKTVGMEEKCTLEKKCSSSEVSENVNCVSGARKKLKTEVDSGADALVNSTRKKQLKVNMLDDKQLETPSTSIQAARRSARLKKSETFKLLQKRLDVYATKRRRKLKDEKYSSADSFQDVMKIDSVKPEKCNDGRSSSDEDHVTEEKYDVNKALLAEQPVATIQNTKVEKLHNVEDNTDDGTVGPLLGRNKRKIKTENGSESSSEKLAPYLSEKKSRCQSEFENETKFPVQSSTAEDTSHVSCKSELQSSCIVPLLSDENKCKEECVDGDISTSASQQQDKGGSVPSSKARTSLEENGSDDHTGHSNGEIISVHKNNASDIKAECTNVSYTKGDVIRKCLEIQHRNKLTVRRPTRKMLNQQQEFVSSHLSQLLKGDFTNEILDTVVEKFGYDDTPVDAVALVRCILKILLQEDCNEIDRSHDVRAPPLSVVEEKLITLIITLRNRCSRFSSLISDFLTAVEYYILNLRTTPEYDHLHLLTRFHAALCKAEGLRERAQAFCYDALYCLKRKCFPVIYTILINFPDVFPRASLGMSSPVCVSIVYSIFTSMNQAINTNLRIKPLITLLCRIYDYKLGEVLSFDLVDCFLNHLKCQSSKSGEVCAAVILLAKRNDRAWTLTQLIPKYLAPIIQEWRCGKINEAVISDVIDLIGCVVKPFSEDCDMGPVLKIFKGILHADQVTQTLKMKAALNLARQAANRFPEVAPTLFEWIPEGRLPDEFWEQMSDILSVKPHNHWMTFLSSFEENTDEMCVGTVNN